MRILCAHPAFRVLEMSLSQLGEKQIAPNEALNDRSLLSISQWWTDKNYFARVQGNAAETGHHTQLPSNSPGRGIVSSSLITSRPCICPHVASLDIYTLNTHL
jgi:hypothetical protein